MKKFLTTILCAFFCTMTIQAQNDTIVTFEQMQNTVGHAIQVCANKYDRVLVYAPENCNDFGWWVNDEQFFENENPIIFNGNLANHYSCWFDGDDCGIHTGFDVYFIDPNVPNETTEEFWKRQYETITLEAVGADSASMYTYFWPHNGATTPTVEVTSQGNYQCLISDMCATAVRTKNVQDNVEIDLATCDLVTNLNLVTWQTTPAQAQYIDHVIVKRDGLNVGTANYSDGFFLDNIGSDLAQRTYTLIAVATDGTECPIVSYPKETIHMAYLTGVNNTIEVNWNTPTGYDLLGYNICEWTPDSKDGDLTVIDFVGASVNSYTCSASMFENGYIVVQGVENSKSEERLLSNRSEETLSIDEQQNKIFKIYPNPSNGTFTVEGNGHLSVRNVLGQEIMTKEVEDKINMELPKGIYFLKMNGRTQKVVVE